MLIKIKLNTKPSRFPDLGIYLLIVKTRILSTYYFSSALQCIQRMCSII